MPQSSTSPSTENETLVVKHYHARKHCYHEGLRTFKWLIFKEIILYSIIIGRYLIQYVHTFQTNELSFEREPQYILTIK